MRAGRGIAAAIAACLLAAAGPAGTQAGLLGFRTGLVLCALGMLSGTATLIWAAVSTLRGRVAEAAIAGVIALLPVAALAPALYHGLSAPPIHDISTDQDFPPVFQATAILHAARENALDHGGAALAARQRAAYPQVVPIVSPLPVGAAFARAHAIAEALGWEIVEAEPAPARIEAIATTRWFGFKDDVAIRIIGQDGGSRIDLRSVSRVGSSDLGANARRIEQFEHRFAAAGQ
ncbi:MAG: DUF1499 domain-containing protein [Gammaproteobacteria bacterium]